jgi:hypothetical protein
MSHNQDHARKNPNMGKSMDRKELIRKFKETHPPMGVYRVRNKSNGKSLIGSNSNLPAILNRHRFQLEAGLHPNRALQSDWNEFGPSAFEFEILDRLDPAEKSDHDLRNDLAVLERLWLDKIEPYGDVGYNPESERDQGHK